MNTQILRNYIDEYKLEFERVNQGEIYKWRAVKCFQDNWDIDAENFLEMLRKSIRLTFNLLNSGQYFPHKMLLLYTEQRPEKLRMMFRNLFEEENDIYQRIIDFQNEIESLNSELFEGKNSYQDHRAVILYLTLRFPERYFFYKFRMFKLFSEKLKISYRPISGRIENIGHFNSLCEIVRYELSKDQELLQLHKDRIKSDCYYDENLNILTQDFIYAVTSYLNERTLPIEETKVTLTENEVLATDLVTTIDSLNFKGTMVNFLQNGIDNKRIGDKGELLVKRLEEEKLKQYGQHKLISKIKHTAKDEGDGTGYDIQSFDKNGNKIYIEVKTTKGAKNTTFYITRTELERSKIEGENYYLYRLYNYNEEKDTAEIFIIRGNLTNLCTVPITYKINLSIG